MLRRARASLLSPLVIGAALTVLGALGACNDEDPVRRRTCNGVTEACKWNRDTRHYDKECTYQPADAGFVCDGGAPADAGSN